MQEIYIENIREVIRGKSLLEQELGLKITNKGKNIFVDGSADNEFLGLQVFDAIKIGFSVEESLKLKQEGMILQTINIKDITNRCDLNRIRARLIGSKGRTLNTLEKLTGCSISLKNNEVGLIGDAETMDDSVQAIISLIHGSKQGNVYARLERECKKKRLESKKNIKNELKSQK